jgi:glycosyltransferase involved in cell wall biosynthesis
VSSEAAREAVEDELAIVLAARRLRGRDEESTHGVTVVVCTRDRPELLDGCLAAVARQLRKPDEVIVVDNASASDETRRVAERWKARCVVEPRPGLDRARNTGLREATTELVAFTDDDARPEPGWLGALGEPFASPDVHAVTGLVLPAELRTPAQLLFEDVYGGMGKGLRLRLHAERARLRPPVRPERVGVGCNMAFRRAALLELGGFDPALDVGTRTGGGGDLDVFERCLEATTAVVYVPGAVVRHLHRADMDGLRRQLFDNGRGYGAMLAAAYVRGDGTRRRAVLRRGASWFLRWQVARFARSVIGREELPARLVAAELAGAPLGPSLYLAERRAAEEDERA